MGKTSAESKNKYRNKTYDQINIIAPKGRKEIIQAHAQGRDESLSGFINRAIDETMERDNSNKE